MNVLKNSSRELMCKSVLPGRLAKKASQYDLQEEDGTDVGKVLIGQNASLLWAQKGAQESALGKEVQAHDGDKVSMEFLLEHKDVGEEHLHLGYFREEPISKILNEATSVMQVSSQDVQLWRVQGAMSAEIHDHFCQEMQRGMECDSRV